MFFLTSPTSTAPPAWAGWSDAAQAGLAGMQLS